MRFMKFLLILLFAVATYGQLPDRGSLADIKGLSKVYVIADADSLKRIEKQIGKVFKSVNSPDDAEFFIDYKTLERERVTSLQIPSETGQMDVYINRNSKKVIAWSMVEYGGGFRGDTPGALAKKFVKAWKALTKSQ